MKTLDRLQLTEKTLVVFCSDNGPVLDDGYKDGAIENIGTHRAGGPFTGGKYSVFEGGTRTPFITRWPGKISPGQSGELVCTIDLAASLAKLTGESLPSDGCLDSVDVLDALLGRDEAKGRMELVTQNNGNNGTYALRQGEWKLHRYDKKTAYNKVVERKLANTKMPEFALFDLAKDPGGTKDVAQDQPAITKRMTQRLARIIEAGRSRP